MMFTGLAVAFGYRAGLFNIGAEGHSCTWGAFAAAWVGFTFTGPASPQFISPWQLWPAWLGGAIWGCHTLVTSRRSWESTR
jgi:ABC-type uncharacterized transport system permease subunit